MIYIIDNGRGADDHEIFFVGVRSTDRPVLEAVLAVLRAESNLFVPFVVATVKVVEWSKTADPPMSLKDFRGRVLCNLLYLLARGTVSEPGWALYERMKSCLSADTLRLAGIPEVPPPSDDERAQYTAHMQAQYEMCWPAHLRASLGGS